MAEITAGPNPIPAKQWPKFTLSRLWHHPVLIPFHQALKGNKMQHKVEELVDQSKYILTLEEGWDGEDGSPVNKAIWETATSFLRAYVKYIDQRYGFSFDLPEINPLRDGSIDLEWRTSKGRLLINFNEKHPHEASFYGDRYADEDSIKGNVDVKEVKEHLAIWMKNCL